MARRKGKSSIRRRSGMAVVGACQWYDWQPDVVVQVGVGCSYQEVDEMLETWGDGVKFRGFEAHPEIADDLRRDYPGIVYEMAIGNHEDCAKQKTKFFTKSKHRDGSSLSRHYNQNPRNKYEELEVEIRSLDWMWAQTQRRVFGTDMLLWLDCEGAEYRALQGAADFFIDHVTMVNVEMTAQPQGDDYANPVDVHRILHEYGFARTWCHTTRHRIGQYDAIYVTREMLRPELCMCPCELENL